MAALRSLRVLNIDSRPGEVLPRSLWGILGGLTRLEDVLVYGIESTPRLDRDTLSRWSHIRTLRLDPSPIDGSFLDEIGAGHEITQLQLWKTQVTDDQLGRLVSRQPNLEDLELDGSRLTDAGAAALAGLPRLKVLRLRARPGTAPRLTDATLAAIGQIRGLQELYLTEGRFTDAGLDALRGPSLKRLELGEVTASDAAWTRFLAANTPGRLALLGSGITDATLPVLVPHLKPKTNLSLSHSAVTDAGMVHLMDAPLGVLTLNDTALTDAGLATLAQHKAVWLLGVTATRVTPAGVAAFRRARPQIQLYTEGWDEEW